MKKLGYFLFLVAMLVILPLTVFADGETETTDNKVKVYFFRGEGCPHCAEAEEWFESIQDEYGEKITIVDYETWYNEDNSALMTKVATVRGESEQATGVPYIIVGDKSWVGFSEATMADEIKAQIDTVYAQDVDSRYDIMELVSLPVEKESHASDVIALIIILVVVGGICYIVYKARNTVN